MCGRRNVVRLAFFSERASFWKQPAEGEGDGGEMTAAGAHSFSSRHSASPWSLDLALDLQAWNNPRLSSTSSTSPSLPSSAFHLFQLSSSRKPPLTLMECAGFGSGMIRAAAAQQQRVTAPMSDSGGWRRPLSCLTGKKTKKHCCCFGWQSCWRDNRE